MPRGSFKLVFMVEMILIPFVYVVIYSLLYVLVPAIAIYQESILSGLRRSFMTFRANPLMCMLLAAGVLAGPVLV